ETKALGTDDVARVARGIVAITLIVELTVALLLFLCFLTAYDHAPGPAAWHAVYHAVSSFNNARFALFSDNLMGFVSDPWICLPIAASIILGGLGFPVIMQLRREWRRPLRWSMNTRIVIVMTVLLLVLGSAYVTLLEWNNPATLG